MKSLMGRIYLGLMLGISLMLTSNAFAQCPYPSSCTPTCNSSCQYDTCVSSSAGTTLSQIPTTIYPAVGGCANPGLYINKIASTYSNAYFNTGTVNQLPMTPSVGYSQCQQHTNNAVSCGGGQVCMANGSCCTQSWYIYAQGSCSVSCGGGTQTDYWFDGCTNYTQTYPSCNTQSCGCPGGVECGGAGVTGYVGQSVCGSDCQTEFLCTASGWQADGSCPSPCPGGVECGGAGVNGYVGQVVCGSDCQTQYYCSASGWQWDGACPSPCPGGVECGGAGVNGYVGQTVCGSDCHTEYLCTASGWQWDGACPPQYCTVTWAPYEAAIVNYNATDVSNYTFCTSDGSAITGVSDSCGYGTYNAWCYPQFTVLQAGASCPSINSSCTNASGCPCGQVDYGCGCGQGYPDCCGFCGGDGTECNDACGYACDPTGYQCYQD